MTLLGITPLANNFINRANAGLSIKSFLDTPGLRFTATDFLRQYGCFCYTRDVLWRIT